MAARTARPGGAQRVDGAQSALLVGPSGYPLPMQDDETLRVRDTEAAGAFSPSERLLARLVLAQEKTNEELMLLRNSVLEVQGRNAPVGRWNERYGRLRTVSRQVPGITTQGTSYTASDAVGLPFRFDGMAGGSGEGGTIVQATLILATAVSINVGLYLFDSPIAGSADNAAFAPTDTEVQTLVAQIPILQSASSTVGFPLNNRIGFAAGNAGQVYSPTSAALPYSTGPMGELYGQLVTGTIFTITAGENAYLKLIYMWGYPSAAGQL